MNDRIPVSLMTQLIPNILEWTFTTIKSTAEKIRDTARRVRINKHQCTRLSERIDNIVEFLQNSRLKGPINSGLKNALERFEAFLQRCLIFITKFTKSNWFHKIVRNYNYHQQFQQFNQELSEHCQDLNFGLAFILHQRFAKEDEQDAQNDLQDIAATVNQIKTQSSPKVESNFPKYLGTNIKMPGTDQWNYHQRYPIFVQHRIHPMNYMY